jgi:hypothetical protein
MFCLEAKCFPELFSWENNFLSARFSVSTAAETFFCLTNSFAARINERVMALRCICSAHLHGRKFQSSSCAEPIRLQQLEAFGMRGGAIDNSIAPFLLYGAMLRKSVAILM